MNRRAVVAVFLLVVTVAYGLLRTIEAAAARRVQPEAERPDARFGGFAGALAGETTAVFLTDRPPAEANPRSFAAQYALSPVRLDVMAYDPALLAQAAYRGVIVCDFASAEALRSILRDPRIELLASRGEDFAIVRRR